MQIQAAQPATQCNPSPAPPTLRGAGGRRCCRNCTASWSATPSRGMWCITLSISSAQWAVNSPLRGSSPSSPAGRQAVAVEWRAGCGSQAELASAGTKAFRCATHNQFSCAHTRPTPPAHGSLPFAANSRHGSPCPPPIHRTRPTTHDLATLTLLPLMRHSHVRKVVPGQPPPQLAVGLRRRPQRRGQGLLEEHCRGAGGSRGEGRDNGRLMSAGGWGGLAAAHSRAEYWEVGEQAGGPAGSCAPAQERCWLAEMVRCREWLSGSDSAWWTADRRQKVKAGRVGQAGSCESFPEDRAAQRSRRHSTSGCGSSLLHTVDNRLALQALPPSASLSFALRPTHSPTPRGR